MDSVSISWTARSPPLVVNLIVSTECDLGLVGGAGALVLLRLVLSGFNGGPSPADVEQLLCSVAPIPIEWSDSPDTQIKLIWAALPLDADTADVADCELLVTGSDTGVAEFSLCKRLLVICVWVTPSRSVRCRISNCCLLPSCTSESVEIRSGSLSKPSSTDRVALSMGFAGTSIFKLLDSIVCKFNCLIHFRNCFSYILQFHALSLNLICNISVNIHYIHSALGLLVNLFRQRWASSTIT